jgi:hypothetical protein
MGNNRGSQTGGPKANKDNSHVSLRKNTELKAALAGSTVRQKAKYRKTLTLCSNLEFAEGDGVDEDVYE